MSTDFTEGEPTKTPATPPAPTGFSESAPAPAPSPPPRDGDDDGEHDPRLAPDSDDRMPAIMANWAGVLTWIIAPLIMYLMQSDRRSLAAWHAREAFNLQLATTVYYLL